MKVVWLCQQEHILPWLNDLRHELGKLCEVVAYGDGEEFIPEFDAVNIVEREDPDVIMIGSNQYKFTNLDKIKIPKALKCTDPWANIERHVEFIKTNHVELVLLNYNCCLPEYMGRLPEGQLFGRLPHTINPENFKDLRMDRIVDVMCIGEGCPVTYPLRNIIYHALPTFKGINGYVAESHTLTFEDYIKAINRAKMFALGNVNRKVADSPILIFPMAKIYEIMGCGTLCMMDAPDEAYELQFVPDYNFVEINKDNFKEKIEYYQQHEYERLRIAKRGLRTVLKYHTIQARAFELKDMLEGIMRK